MSTSLNLTVQGNPRPNPFVSTINEAITIANSLLANGLEPQPAPGSGYTEPLVQTVAASIRKAASGELYYPQDTRESFVSQGYDAYILEWIGPAMQGPNGESTYIAIPPPTSIFYAKRLPMGTTYYAEVVGILVDMLASTPNQKWYMLPDGSVTRK